MGIISSAKFSFENNILNKQDYNKIINHINFLEFTSDLKYYFERKHINKIIKYMKSDKKNNSSKINLILIKRIGKVILGSRFNEIVIKKFLNKELIN